jgi:glycosyltransferase involved in cell wall biosynthesis
MPDVSKRRRVWLINHYALPPGGVGSTRHFSLARHLSRYGWSATVISASTELNTNCQRLADHEQQRSDTVDGVDFLWIRTPVYQGNGGGRMKNMLAFAYRLLLPSTTRRLQLPDVVVGSSVHPFAALSGALLARKFGVPFVFEVRDLWPQTLIDMGRIRESGLTARAMWWLEDWLCRRAACIVTLLPRAADYFESRGVSRDKVVWVSNGVEVSDYPLALSYKPRDIFTLMYFGAHGQANDLETLIDAVGLLDADSRSARLRVLLVGDGPLKPYLQQRVRDNGLETVICFEPPVAKRKVPQLAAQADAFVICVKDLPRLYRFGISMNKLFDYLAAARPVIIASNAINNPVADAHAGLSVSAGDAGGLADAIFQLMNSDAEQREAMSRNGRRYVERHYSYAALAARFAQVLDDVVR